MRPLAAIGAILVMIGLVIRSISISNRNQIEAFGEHLERLTLKALIDRGPQGPKNVIITDYVLCANGVIEELFAALSYGSGPMVFGPDDTVDHAPDR